jgi:hypothetical protein
MNDFNQGFMPHAAAIAADMPSYTDISPVMQFSEVVVA